MGCLGGLHLNVAGIDSIFEAVARTHRSMVERGLKIMSRTSEPAEGAIRSKRATASCSGPGHCEVNRRCHILTKCYSSDPDRCWVRRNDATDKTPNCIRVNRGKCYYSIDRSICYTPCVCVLYILLVNRHTLIG